MRQLEERTSQFKVGDIIAMNDPRSNITLMPDFPGMTDSENCAAWDTGFPMDLDAIRDKDRITGTPTRAHPRPTSASPQVRRFGATVSRSHRRSLRAKRLRGTGALGKNC